MNKNKVVDSNDPSSPTGGKAGVERKNKVQVSRNDGAENAPPDRCSVWLGDGLLSSNFQSIKNIPSNHQSQNHSTCLEGWVLCYPQSEQQKNRHLLAPRN